MTVGFADFAATIIRNNRRLRQNLKSKYFNRNVHSATRPLAAAPKDNRDYTRAHALRKKTIRKQLVFLSLAIVITFLVVLKFSSGAIFNYGTKYRDNLEVISEQAADQLSTSGYYFMIKQANSHLEAGNTEAARKEFQKAKDLFINGKEANFGIAQCLLIECKSKSTYCEIASDYFDIMMSSKLLTEKELRKLKALRSATLLAQ